MKHVNYEVLNISITLDYVCHSVQYARSPQQQQIMSMIKSTVKDQMR